MRATVTSLITLFLNFSTLHGSALSVDGWKDETAYAQIASDVADAPNNRDLILSRGSMITHWVTTDQLLEKLAKVRKLQEATYKAATWVGEKLLHTHYFSPVISRLTLPVGSRVLFQGDLHCDMKTLMASIEAQNNKGDMEGFKIVSPNLYLMFLGDYTDKGVYGLETLWLVAHLKILNPNQVFLSRGNHEDILLNYQELGFIEEITMQQQKVFSLFQHFALERFYNALPVAYFIRPEGSDKHILCAHGGLEVGIDHRPLLASTAGNVYQQIGVPQRECFLAHWQGQMSSPVWQQTSSRMLYRSNQIQNFSPTDIGYLWNDFVLVPNAATSIEQESGRLEIGAKDTELYFGEEVLAMIRAHQHSQTSLALLNENEGVYSHFHPKAAGKFPIEQNMVLTFTLGADSIVGRLLNINYSTYGILHLAAKEWQQWEMEVFQTHPLATFAPERFLNKRSRVKD